MPHCAAVLKLPVHNYHHYRSKSLSNRQRRADAEDETRELEFFTMGAGLTIIQQKKLS